MHFLIPTFSYSCCFFFWEMTGLNFLSPYRGVTADTRPFSLSLVPVPSPWCITYLGDEFGRNISDFLQYVCPCYDSEISCWNTELIDGIAAPCGHPAAKARFNNIYHRLLLLCSRFPCCRQIPLTDSSAKQLPSQQELKMLRVPQFQMSGSNVQGGLLWWLTVLI